MNSGNDGGEQNDEETRGNDVHEIEITSAHNDEEQTAQNDEETRGNDGGEQNDEETHHPSLQRKLSMLLPHLFSYQGINSL